MIIFLRNIPVQTRHRDIRAFIEPAIKISLFGKKGNIVKIKILHLKDTRTYISEFHGLVTIEPDTAAQKVIKRLNRKKFLGKYIAVREYKRRDWHNDPRLNHKSPGLTKAEGRIGDRRRNSIEAVEDITDKFSGQKNFHRNQC